MRVFVSFMFCLLWGFVSAVTAADPPGVLVIIDGKPVTEADLEFLYLSRRVPTEQRAAVRKRMLDVLVERRVMRDYLEARGAKADPREIDAQVAQVMELIRKQGDDPTHVLAKLGYSEESLRQELALPLMWRSYVALLVTPKRLRDYFENHRAKFDGTKVRARQVFLKLPQDATEAAVIQAEATLRGIKNDVTAGSLTFEQAAQKFSQAATKNQGGDVGWIRWRGDLPAAVSTAAFSLEVGQISEPIRSPFGLHLVQVTDRRAGELSLEDVRPTVFNALSRQLWEELTAAQLAKAQVEWRIEREQTTEPRP